ncbi:NAD(P)H-hydrate dehydratase [Shewanella woodyi]|uniref:NAD(P)H-hydrate dehydratase n=1 Tax=Shewanella woodyi TaxID=60961 RepID=UPI0035B53B28
MHTSMIHLPVNLFLASQVEDAEKAFVGAKDISLNQLVEAAGTKAFELLSSSIDRASPILLLAGYGNNGADTYVCARLLIEAGYQISLMGLDKTQMGTEVLSAQSEFRRVGGRVECSDIDKILSASIIVDGLLGVGCKGELRGQFKPIIEAVNLSKAKVFSLDIPSGLNPDTGAGEGAVIANVTLTFGAVKQGLLTGRARACVGELLFADIGLTEYLSPPSSKMISLDFVREHIIPRSKYSHKGDSGKVSIIGGDTGMAGAVRLAAEACLRAGSGLVTVISKPAHQLAVNATRPELMFWGCDLVDMEVYLKLGWADVLLIGPGLGQQDWGYNLLKAVGLSDKPCVLDADALNMLSREPYKQEKWVLTPHSAEAAKLLGITTGEVEQDRFAAVKAIQTKYGGVAVLKGPGTLICGAKECVVAPVGNPGLASGGAGDALGGVISALMAQGFDSFTAAKMGVVIHGEAADRAALEGERGMLASDLMPHIRHLVNNL